MIATSVIIVIPQTFILFTLQLSNRIKEYSKIVITERMVFSLIVIVFLVMGGMNYKIIVYTDILAKLVSLSLGIAYSKDIISAKPVKLAVGLKEVVDNVRIGIKLMFSTIANMLIIGVVRFGIEKHWDIVTFGKVSLTLSISNIFMVFANAVGIVLFPMLRNTSKERLPGMYIKMRNLLMIPLLGLLVVFYPIRWISTLLLPQYIDALPYMALLFPICIYESRTSMLINTYYNTLRKEKLMLMLNLIILCVSLVSAYLCIVVLSNLTLSVLSILLLLAFKCILSEVVLARVIKIRIWKDILLEIGVTGIFVPIAWFISDIYGLIIFVFVYGIYLLIKRKAVVETWKLIKTALDRTREAYPYVSE